MQQQHRLGATAALIDPGGMPIDLDALAHAIPPLASILPSETLGQVSLVASVSDIPRSSRRAQGLNNRAGRFHLTRRSRRPEQRDGMTSMTSSRLAPKRGAVGAKGSSIVDYAWVVVGLQARVASWIAPTRDDALPDNDLDVPSDEVDGGREFERRR
jgi:hypothetical protein